MANEVEDTLTKNLEEHNFDIQPQSPGTEFAQLVREITEDGNSKTGTLKDLGNVLQEASQKLEPVENPNYSNDEEYPNIEEAVLETIKENPYVGITIGDRKEQFAQSVNNFITAEVGYLSLPGEARHAVEGLSEAVKSTSQELEKSQSLER